MRSLLTVILIFFITGSCFALKPEKPAPALYAAKQYQSSAVSRFHHLFHTVGHENLDQDDFEHSPLIRQVLHKQLISSIQLFHLAENHAAQFQLVPAYTANANFNYNFIYHFLYPKHVFW